MKYFVLFILLSSLILACNKSEIFVSKEFGWTFEIPDGWNIEDEAGLKENVQKGIEMLDDKNANTLLITGNEKIILALRKDRLNKLRVVAIPYKQTYKDQWKKNYPDTKRKIYDSFAAMNFQVDSSSARSKIDGVKFEVFKITASSGNVKIKQIMYRTLRKNHELVITATFTEPENWYEIKDAIKNSSFD